MLRLSLLGQFLAVSGVVAAVLLLASYLILGQLQGDPDDARFRLLTFLFTAGVAGVVILVGLLHSRLIAARIRRVLQGMEEVGQGQYPRVLVEGEDEVGALTRGFNQMVEGLRSRDDRLKSWASQNQTQVVKLSQSLEEEREKLEAVLDSIGEGVIVLDSESKVVMANWRVAQIFGVPMETLVGTDLQTLINQVRHRLVDRAEVEQKLSDLQRNPDLVTEITLQLDAPGGQTLRLYCAPVLGANGRLLGRIATSLDLGKERELERLKTEFLSTISHELRTPLTSIKGALGLIRGGAAGNISSDMGEMLDIALTNTERLIQVINNILDIVQLERGQARMRPVAMPLAESAVRAVEAVLPQAEARRIFIENRIGQDVPAVRADPRRVEQVLVNLLSNAIKFSRQDSRIILQATADDGAVTVSVQDFGRGMSKDYLSRLFTKFEHAQGSLTRDHQGAGLGLAICRHIVEHQGGRIWVESREDEGSTFQFTLPVAGAVPGTPRAVEAPAGEFAGRRLILVVDDDVDVARVISYVFESLGHSVLTAHSGKEAVEMARKYHPDLLTLDIIMPDIDGLQVLKTLRSQDDTRGIPIICISAQPDPGQALTSGADYYLEKPIDLEKLRDIAGRALSAVAATGGTAL